MTSQKASLFSVAISNVTDSCLLRDTNSTMYCIAAPHYVTIYNQHNVLYCCTPLRHKIQTAKCTVLLHPTTSQHTNSTMYCIATPHYVTTYKHHNELYCCTPLRHNIQTSQCTVLLHPTTSQHTNSTMYCIAPSHYVTTAPSTILTVSTVY
jgi:hypothetical protein